MTSHMSTVDCTVDICRPSATWKRAIAAQVARTLAEEVRTAESHCNRLADEMHVQDRWCLDRWCLVPLGPEYFPSLESCWECDPICVVPKSQGWARLGAMAVPSETSIDLDRFN